MPKENLVELVPMVCNLQKLWKEVDKSNTNFPNSKTQPMVFEISLKDLQEILNYANDEKNTGENKIEKLAGILCHCEDGYRNALFEKLNVKSRVGLALYAVKHELVKF